MKGFGTFVRLNLTGEIVEVVGSESADITIKYRGEYVTLCQHEVSAISSTEATKPISN